MDEPDKHTVERMILRPRYVVLDIRVVHLAPEGINLFPDVENFCKIKLY